MGRRQEFGIGALALAFAVLASGVTACGQERGDGATGAARAALGSAPAGTAVSTRFTYGAGGEALGYRRAVGEHVAVGAPAVAVGPGGEVFVLDALKGRVLRAYHGGLLPVLSELPQDVDDLAVGPDGALAVRRSVRPEVLVFAPDGARIGSVDTSAVHTIDGISLGRSRRVVVTSPFQEAFVVGSPSVPQIAEQILANRREGAAFLASGEGVVVVRRNDGELELRVVPPGDRDEGRGPTRALPLGKGAAGRVVGVTGQTVCMRIEHLGDGERGAIAVDREAACVDVASGDTVFRAKLPGVGTYVPRHELAFAHETLVHARPTDQGLDVTTWTIHGALR